nr:uncharacterized protein CI109_002130 [Kwoniella shandongensis]KAA5529704.1 hypothetical protein CI109_002130 [Kwoniella shandongensis]
MVHLAILAIGVLVAPVFGQTFRRTAACPELGCIFPPDQTDFIAGQTFDIRIEVHAPVNGSEAYNNGQPGQDFSIKIGGQGADPVDLTQFFGISDPIVESYNFSYYEDLFAEDEHAHTPVNVLAKSYRNLQLHNPGTYDLVFTYNDGMTTTAQWTVLPLADCKKAKNVIFFVGDGMASSMISAARLLGHKTVNGKYQTKLKMDEAPGFGAQMTHSLDSFITDSANSASALFSGKKMTVNGLNAYTDSTGKAFGDPKVETIFEMFRRQTGGQVGIVSKAYIADATPAAVVTHTSQRSQYTAIIEQYLKGVTGNHSWFPWEGVDLLFGGGAENFLPGPGNGNVSQFERWASEGYQVGYTKTELEAFDNAQRALAIFTRGNISTWLDKNVYTETLDLAITPQGQRGAYDQPGLKDMTLKAIDILHTRAKSRDTGFMLMSEAALIDKEMHVLDIDRALGEVLELDDTLRAVLEHLEKIGELEDTLVVVTADHAHGFDVFGSTDTKYLQAQNSDRAKRSAVGTYQSSGLSAYQVPQDVLPTNQTVFPGPQGDGFPVTWDPRYTIAHGWAAIPDHREDFQVNKDHERVPAVSNSTGYFFNPNDNQRGFAMTGNLGVSEGQGVHSLVDVPVYAWGPGHEFFRGVMNSPDLAFKVALALDLGKSSNLTAPYKK